MPLLDPAERAEGMLSFTHPAERAEDEHGHAGLLGGAGGDGEVRLAAVGRQAPGDVCHLAVGQPRLRVAEAWTGAVK